MSCPSCGQRKGRRACPALGQTICRVCCGTKRLTEIQCPADCVHLATAREHPAAVVRRQQEHDIALVLPTVNTLSRGQFERGARDMRHVADGGPRAYLLTMGRLVREAVSAQPPEPTKPPNLIIP